MSTFPDLNGQPCRDCDGQGRVTAAQAADLRETVTQREDADRARRITRHLASVWGWLEDEPEAVALGEDLAPHLRRAVERTSARPDVLLSALLHPGHAAPTEQPGGFESRVVALAETNPAAEVKVEHVVFRTHPDFADPVEVSAYPTREDAERFVKHPSLWYDARTGETLAIRKRTRVVILSES